MSCKPTETETETGTGTGIGRVRRQERNERKKGRQMKGSEQQDEAGGRRQEADTQLELGLLGGKR